MVPATTRFFTMPELVAHLTQFLDHSGISRLMQTSRCLHQLCTPAHYYKVSASHKHFAHNLFSATDSIQAFAKNVHRVRYIDFKRHDIVYYVNSVIAFLNIPVAQQNAATVTTIGHQPAVSQPAWLAPPDPHICTVLPIPPMTLLTKLKLNLAGRRKCEDCSYYLPSYRDPKATLTQVCWIIDFNPHLLDLSLKRAIIKDVRDAHLLARSISGLSRLQSLFLDLWQWGEELTEVVTQKAGTDIFFACSPTLQSFSIVSHSEDLSDSLVFADDYIFDPPGTLQPWEKSNEECGLTMTTPTRQGPLEELKKLLLGHYHEEATEEALQSMLQHCPNLTTIEMPALLEINNIRQLAKELVQYCPKLSDLSSDGFSGGGESTRRLLVWILWALPPQQAIRFHCGGIPSFTVHGMDDAASIFRRHSRTLREIFLNGCQNIDSKTIQMIMVECGPLERLTIMWSINGDQQKSCLKLDDAIEFPWACTRIQDLRLTIAIPDRPLHHLADGVAPYYKRSPPTILSVEETQQFKDLESLYQQLGTLTELERLGLRAIFFDASGDREVSGDFTVNTFPGLFSLGRKKSGWPGYLHLLGGLTKLKELNGSTCLLTEETEVTVGMDEVAWMNHHWPALEKAHFGKGGQACSDVLVWWEVHQRLKALRF